MYEKIVTKIYKRISNNLWFSLILVPPVNVITRSTHPSCMNSFRSYLFREAYKKIHKLGDKLARIEPLIDWEAFRPIVQGLYDNKGPKGGRPNVDPVVMVKLLRAQQ